MKGSQDRTVFDPTRKSMRLRSVPPLGGAEQRSGGRIRAGVV